MGNYISIKENFGQMSFKRTVYIYREETIKIGEENFIDSSFEDFKYGVIFEDDGNTGYFYAVNNGTNVLDALHIYNVEDVIDKNIPSLVKILWTEDLSLCFLSINNYIQAVFDFKNKAGFCRNGFPESNRNWIKEKNRLLTDDLLEKL